MKSKLLLISLLSLFVAACSPESQNPDLPAQINNHLSEAVTSYEVADTLWQQILDGDPAVSCVLTLTVPELFDLTVSQAEEHPESVVIRDHLNNAIAILSEIKLLWETECQQESAIISLNTIRLVLGLLEEAQTELRAANEAWVAWQS